MLSARFCARLLACLVVLVPAAALDTARAGVPSPDDSEVPCGINFVGTRGGVSDPRGTFTIIIRDLAQNPIPGCVVAIDFCACAGSPGLCLATSQPDPDVLQVSPDGCQVVGVANAEGKLTLSLVGHATGLPPGPSCAPEIYGDGVKIAIVWPPIMVGAFDLDGAQGVAPPDLSHWLDDSFAPAYRSRADYDCSRSVTPADLARLLDVSLAGDSQVSAANAVCH